MPAWAIASSSSDLAPLQATEPLKGIFQPTQATSVSGHQLGQMLYFMTMESRRTIIDRHIDEPGFFPCR